MAMNASKSTSRARSGGWFEVVPRLLKLRRLMQRHGVELRDALDLLTFQLEQLEERQRWEEERQHLDYPIWLYGPDR